MAGERLWMVHNGAKATTAAPVAVTTGTAIKTMLQLTTTSTQGLYVTEWGISFDGSTAATPIKVEFFGCAITTPATVTSLSSDSNLHRLSDPLATETSPLTYSNTTSGYTASSEGTVVTMNMWDLQYVAPTGQYVKQFPLGREPSMALSTNARIRVTAGAAVNCYCYVVFGTT